MQTENFRKKTLAAAAAFMLLSAAMLYSQDSSGQAGNNETESAIVLEDGGNAVLPDATGSGEPGSLWVLVRIVLVLLLVCAGIYGVVFLLKKSSGTSAASDPYLRIVAKLPLAPGKTVQVVTVGTQAFLIGLSESGIQYLAELSDRELIDAMNLEADRNPGEPVPSFSALLSRFMPKTGERTGTTSANPGKNDTTEPLSAGETADFIRRQRERLGKTGRNETGDNRTGRSE